MRVLLLEDHAGVATATKMLLTRNGHDVLGPAVTLAAALELCEAEQPQAAVVDLTLPDARGSQAPQALRAAAPDMTIVVFSALSGAEDDDAGQHADAVIVKGDTATLLETLADIAGQ